MLASKKDQRKKNFRYQRFVSDATKEREVTKRKILSAHARLKEAQKKASAQSDSFYDKFFSGQVQLKEEGDLQAWEELKPSQEPPAPKKRARESDATPEMPAEEKQPAAKRRKIATPDTENTNTDRFTKAREKYSQKMQQKLAKQKEKETKQKKLTKRQHERSKVTRNLGKRTKRGQLVMANLVSHLVSKIEKQV